MEKRMESRAMSVFIVFMLLMGVIFVVATDTVAAVHDGDYIYTVVGSDATITGYTGGGAITIPSTLGGNNVVAIGDQAFLSCTSLTSVTIPDSVTSIGTYAFRACTSLTAVNVAATNPNYASVDGVLYDKAKTILIQYPGGKAGAFAIPNTVTTIEDSAFYSCTALTSVTIPASVAIIKGDAFSVCTALTSVTISGGVTAIGGYAFHSCTNLTAIIFLGLVAPTDIGKGWINDTGLGISGHAYHNSNFPVPGNNFSGLMMGPAILVLANQSEVTISGGESMALDVKGETYVLTVTEVTVLQATFEIHSEPNGFNLAVGDSKDIDVDHDGKDDVRIKLSSIEGSEVGLSITAISETSQGSYVTILAVIGAIALLVVIGITFLVVKRSKGKGK